MPTLNPAAPNRLLAALPEPDYKRLAPHLKPVALPQKEVLYDTDQPIQFVYFPSAGMVSLVHILEEGNNVEVGIIGSEGLLGLPVVLSGKTSPARAIVQVPGEALRLPAEMLAEEFSRGGALHDLLLSYTLAFLNQVSQTAACNRAYVLEVRLARWLLLVQDRAQSEELPLTQEFIADMLGSPRAMVTIAAGALQKAGVISYRRGRITVLDRAALEAAACECYEALKQRA